MKRGRSARCWSGPSSLVHVGGDHPLPPCRFSGWRVNVRDRTRLAAAIDSNRRIMVTCRIARSSIARRRGKYGMNLFKHPLSTPAWEQERAAPLRLGTRASWATPDEHEPDAPRRRIIHQRAVFGDHPMDLDRLELVDGHGYHKSASGQEYDRPVDVAVYTIAPDGWRLVDRTQGDPVELGNVKQRRSSPKCDRAPQTGTGPAGTSPIPVSSCTVRPADPLTCFLQCRMAPKPMSTWARPRRA